MAKRTYNKEVLDYGTLYPIKERNEMIAAGLIENYDGSGYRCRNGMRSGDDVFNSNAKDATHVQWLNK